MRTLIICADLSLVFSVALCDDHESNTHGSRMRENFSYYDWRQLETGTDTALHELHMFNLS
jgi:hypothetical protein